MPCLAQSCRTNVRVDFRVGSIVQARREKDLWRKSKETKRERESWEHTRSLSELTLLFFPLVFFCDACPVTNEKEDKKINMASAAGTPVDDACVLKFKDLKSKRKYKYVVFKIDDGKIVVCHEGLPAASFDSFVEQLPENEPRYAVMDYEYKKDGCTKSKIFFVNW